MGLRHALGALKCAQVEHLTMSDISSEALGRARGEMDGRWNGKTVDFVPSISLTGKFDVVIMATTATGRLESCRNMLALSPTWLLVEKPLGQSYEEVESVSRLLSSHPGVKASVNLNTRMYPFIADLKRDLASMPQFDGCKYINYSGGTLGIGANGIHYLDLMFHLLDADEAEFKYGEVDDTMIPSGRGPAFGDFGGWACIHLSRAGQLVGKSLIMLSSTSTVFGGWEFIGTHGRIRINELEGTRTDILRNSDSILPVNRYGGEYMEPVIRVIESPPLSDLTCQWLEGLAAGHSLLPDLHESLKVHRVMFEWLSASRTHKGTFPIT
jgi:predicted dehydrogenase